MPPSPQRFFVTEELLIFLPIPKRVCHDAVGAIHRFVSSGECCFVNCKTVELAFLVFQHIHFVAVYFLAVKSIFIVCKVDFFVDDIFF